MGIYTKKALTQREKASQKCNRVGNDVVKLRSSESEKIKQERMRWKRKPPVHMRKKKNPVILPRMRFDLTWARKVAAMARD